jgi:hypothetical protein
MCFIKNNRQVLVFGAKVDETPPVVAYLQRLIANSKIQLGRGFVSVACALSTFTFPQKVVLNEPAETFKGVKWDTYWKTPTPPSGSCYSMAAGPFLP